MNDVKRNNFDLIRLFAASQVAISHIAGHLGVENSVLSILGLFPGVPIFFFVSGYLIYGSYEHSTKNPNTNRNFFIKRFLRIYPALWLCFVLSTISIWASGYLSKVDFSIFDFIVWTVTQNTIFQFYNPEFMRGYGVGVINGSLWTISVELQFYLLTPFIFYILNKFKLAPILFFVFFLLIANVANSNLNERISIYQKLLHVSFLPWLYMFILGSLAYKYSSILNIVKRNHLLNFIGLYVLSYFCTKNYGWGNDINPISFIFLAVLTLKIAYTRPYLSDAILRRQDISYGVYIFHMPIVNYLLYQEKMGITSLFLATLATIFVSCLSWFFYEKRFLAIKKSALRKNLISLG